MSADVYRPAAIKQLETLASDVGVDFFPSSADQKPLDIANAAIDHAKKKFYDVLLVDTAGRLIGDSFSNRLCRMQSYHRLGAGSL